MTAHQMIAAMVEGRNTTTARDRTVTIMEAKADQTIADVRVQMTLRMIVPMGSLVQRTARVTAHQMIAAMVEGTNIAVEGRNITVEGTDITVEGTNIAVEGTNIAVEGTNITTASDLGF